MPQVHVEQVGGYRVEEWDKPGFPFVVVYEDYGIAQFKMLADAKEYMNFKLDKDELMKLAKREYQVHRASPTMCVIGLKFVVKLFHDTIAGFANEQEAINFAKERNKREVV